MTLRWLRNHSFYGFLVLTMMLFSASQGFCQIDNVKLKRIAAVNDTVVFDSLSVLPNSMIVIAAGDTLSAQDYFLDEARATFFLLKSPEVDSLTLSFRTLPFYLGNQLSHKSTALITKKYQSVLGNYVLSNKSPAESLFDDKSLNKSGSVSRGILFGNNQNLSVNSTLNLQLSGKVSDKYSILASVSDDNIPIQPDGNTQQLQDFDQVFIQLYDDRSKIIAGDFQLNRPAGYFMNYFKRAQGAYFNSSSVKKSGDIPVLRIEASASISKGRFARNTIQGVEGNQGPYRLTGADNELFIIVLAGTEMIYIDGRLLERGVDKDYVIDYNAAEITFTPRQFITKDRRINVEFQYSEKRYARPLLQSSIEYNNRRGQYFFNFFSENDAKNQPLQQDLDAEDKAILASAGDDFFSSLKSGVDSVGYNNAQVLYAITDSLGFDSVFVFSQDSALAIYRVVFSLVGSGNGDYVEDGFSANGKKYRWVAPVLGASGFIRQGNYAPVVLLAAPKKNQMISTGAKFKFGRREYSFVSAETAMSVRDQNTFSTADSGDDVGFAARILYKWDNTTISSDTSKKIFALYEAGYEYTGQYFSQIERFREVEFNRNWNVQQLNLNADQHIVNAAATWKTKKLGAMSIGAESFLIADSYRGFKSKLNTAISTPKKWVTNINASFLSTSGQLKSQFLRHRGFASKEFGKLKLYYRDEHEYNLFFVANSDSLSGASYQFYDWEAGFGTADTTSRSIQFFYRDRIDRKPNNTSLAGAARADQYGVNGMLRGKSGNRLGLSVSNRRLRVIDPELFTQAPENTLLARLDYNFKVKSGFIQSSTFYEIGSGLEQRREFIYLEVPAGQGVYIWNDYNNDGVKDLNEFEVAQFTYEANYIRSSVQSNDYLKTFTNQFNQTIGINPARILKKDSWFHRFTGKFSSITTLRADRKTTNENNEERFNPFVVSIADSALLSVNGLFRNALFFNKSNPVFGLDYTFQFLRNKNLLSNGFESRVDEYHATGIRWNLIADFTLFIESRLGQRGASSDFLAGRNFDINYYSLQPKITWQPNTKARLNLLAQFADKRNTTGPESAVIRKLSSDLTLNSPEKGSIQAEVSFYAISFNGEGNNSLAFEMLEGLSSGFNFTWSAGAQRTIGKNLQLGLQYNGRKPRDRAPIHAGGVQIRAIF
jgi:hypothetical protein